ncbi:Type VI secretion system-associated protein [Thiorhodococcus drewsii AZ1]|uniref:Type VI secretion system-associated protein n=1 Tax=Thiorhodococcus drewsii AZ1 TaxID=765913 RepID=G2E1V5_9GAMM|nr:type VI secretion system-associated protein TagF [Thiorhodococcus drewsii]EGV31163.1 Type VI secretion system-associated protein [Thiorhodococcus drewsii AZ1]
MTKRGRLETGFYGKLPALGDFVSRRLPAEFVQPWDLWLRESLANSRLQLGDDWLDIYLTSPLWRFALSPGLVGQAAWAGVMMPSVDRVGRYFPLTLACPLPSGADLMSLVSESDWFERAEILALAALDDSCSLDGFDAQVRALGDLQVIRLANDADSANGLVRTNAWRLPTPATAGSGDVRARLLARALDQMFCGYSLWWSSGSDRVEPSLLVCQGLPPVDGFSALIGGNWTGHGWWEFAESTPDRSGGNEGFS